MNIFGQLYEKIGEGWHPLMDTFSDLVLWDIEFNKMPPVEITGVDEKNGSLRIYYNGGDQRTDSYANYARRASERYSEYAA